MLLFIAPVGMPIAFYILKLGERMKAIAWSIESAGVAIIENGVPAMGRRERKALQAVNRAGLSCRGTAE